MTSRLRLSASGWLTALVRASEDMSERNLGLIAAGVAFYALLAIFPGIAALISLWGYVADPAVVEAQMQLLEGFVPAEAYVLLDEQVTWLIDTHDSTLGWTSIFSILAALWLARAGVAALIQGLGTMYRQPHRNGFWHFIAALSLTLALIVLALLALASIVLAPVAIAFLPDGSVTAAISSALRWVVGLVAMVTGLGLLYRYGPNRQGGRVPWVSPGAVLAVLIWAAASYGFSFYLANFGNYNEVYGSIGAVVALLMWFYVSAYVVLLGAALNFEIEQRWGR